MCLVAAACGCAGARTRAESAPPVVFDCEPTGLGLAGRTDDAENPYEERRTLRGENGSVTDHCTPEGDLVQAICEREPEPRPTVGVVDHSPVRYRRTGRVSEVEVDCDGRCALGACLSACPAGELVVLLVEPDGTALFGSERDPRRIRCPLQASWAGYGCATEPRPGERVEVMGTGFTGPVCTGGAWGSFAVGAPRSGVTRCSYVDCRFVEDDRPIPAEPTPPPPPPPDVLSSWRTGAHETERFGAHVLDRARGRLYVAEPLEPGPAAELYAPLGIAAVELETGSVLWRSALPIWPLGIEAGLLVAAERGALLLLDPETGTELGRCDASIPVTTSTRRGSSGSGFGHERGPVLYTSMTTRYFGGRAPPPDVPLSTRRSLGFEVAIVGTTCSIGAAFEPEPIPVPEPDWEIRRRPAGDEWSLSLGRPGSSDEIVLGLAAPGLVWAGPSGDDATLLVTELQGGEAFIRFYELPRGSPIGEARVPHDVGGTDVVDELFVWASRSELGAADVRTGVEAWRHRLRDRIHRIEPSPP